MKKIIIALSMMLAAVAFTSCSQDLLNIQQKGAVGQDDFYQNDDDALAAITAVYAQMNSYYYNYKFFTNLPSDDIYCGGGSRGDNDQWAQLNEFRTHAQTGSLGSYYRGAYNIIFKCNLLINNMEPNTAVTKRCIAEARFFRAWAHMILTEYWGTPPLITEVLSGAEKPGNTPKAELWKFIIDEFSACSSDLPSKSNKDDKNAVCRITKECALAYMGKAQVISGDYSGAKTTLKKVISSGLYDLVPSSEYDNISVEADVKVSALTADSADVLSGAAGALDIASMGEEDFTNLTNSGILPLTFADEADYDRIEEGDEIRLLKVNEAILNGDDIKLENITKGFTVTLNADLSDRARHIILAGGLLNYTAANK